MPLELPQNTCRLFAHYDDPAHLAGRAPQLILAKLLEEGDGMDLRWLTGAYPESRLATWLRQHGYRQLSSRSRSFWEIVLDKPDLPTRPTGETLWSL